MRGHGVLTPNKLYVGTTSRVGVMRGASTGASALVRLDRYFAYLWYTATDSGYVRRCSLHSSYVHGT